MSLAGLLQQKDLLNADLVNAIESIDGVTGTKRWYYTDAEYRVNDYDDNWIYGFAKEDVSVLEENLNVYQELLIIMNWYQKRASF